MSLKVADNKGTDANEEERKEAEKKTPPVNLPYPFRMRPFPYGLVGIPREPLRKDELVLLGID